MDPNSCFSHLSVSLNLLNSLNLFRENTIEPVLNVLKKSFIDFESRFYLKQKSIKNPFNFLTVNYKLIFTTHETF